LIEFATATAERLKLYIHVFILSLLFAVNISLFKSYYRVLFIFGVCLLEH